ncbi:MAG: hypothetical protein LBI33_08725 [Propionibacteriaceae bacterium]|jgi:hypothetical protein|nr:hypothetical protein [Propionibacteriaceae bacterium]
MNFGSTVRRWANLLNGATPIGLAIARLGHATTRPGPDGLTLAEGYRFRFPAASAFTIGNVLITSRTFPELTARLPRVIAHEARHSTQYVVLGWAFLPLYVLYLPLSYALTRDRALGHPLEILAGLDDGGYRPDPSEPRHRNPVLSPSDKE